jgi:hypothetical protein
MCDLFIIKYLYFNVMEDYPEDLSNKTPEEIAYELFTKEPSNLSPIGLFMEGADNTSYIFEVMITILLEGIDTFSNGINNIEIDLLEKEYLLALNPWFQAIGFNINIDIIDRNNKEQYEDYYCKVVLRNYGYGPIFQEKNIIKDYHFFGNYKYRNGCYIEKLKDIYAVFVKNNQVFKISFDFYKN